MRRSIILSAGLAVGLIASVAPAPAVSSGPRFHLVLQAPPPLSVDSVTVSPDGSLVAAAAIDAGGEAAVRLADSPSAPPVFKLCA